jgi:hypothetical protein
MRKIFFPLIALLWLLFVIVLYYSGHKPAEPEQFLALLTVVWRLAVVALLSALAGGLGARIWKGATFHPLTRLALQVGLGFGLLGLGVLAVGATVGLPFWLPWLALIILVVVLRKSILSWLSNWQALGELWRESGPFERVLAGLLGVIFLVTLGVALAPPVHFDSLTYHFAMPNAYLRDGRVGYLAWIVMSGMPQNAEMLYTWAIALGGDPAAAVLCWSFGLLSALGLWGILRQGLNRRAAWVGVVALLAGFTPAWLLSGGYVDWLVFLLALGALALLIAWREDGSPHSLLLAGLFTGLAVGSKYTSAFLALAGVAVLVWHTWKQPRVFFKAALTYGLMALAVALPWFLKNILSTGNPFYPFFFLGGAMTPVRLQVYQHLPAWGNWLDFIFLPVRATYLGFEAGDGYMFAPGVLLLGLGALAWLAWKESPPTPPYQRGQESPPIPPSKGGQESATHVFSYPLYQGGGGGDSSSSLYLFSTAAILSISGLLLWALGNQYSGNLIQTRYYFSIFPAFAILAAFGDWGLCRLQFGPVRMGRLAAALILLALSFTTIEVTLAGLRNGAPQAALGLKTQETYLAETLGWFQPALKAIRELPEGQRVQLIYEPRSLYCAPRCLPDEILDRWKRAWLSLGDAGAIRQSFRQEGITHLLVYSDGVKFLLENADPHHPPSDLEALEAFLSALPAPVSFGDVYKLYSLESQ